MSNADLGADIRADAPATPRSARPARRVWPWVLGGALLFTLLAAGSVAALLLTVFDGLRDHAHVVINGQPWHWGGDWLGDWNGVWSDDNLGDGFGSGVIGFIVGTVCVVLAGLLVVVIVVPIVALVVGFVGLAVAFAVAAVLGSVGLVAALVLSPLWLFALLLWLVFRRRPQRATA